MRSVYNVYCMQQAFDNKASSADYVGIAGMQGSKTVLLLLTHVSLPLWSLSRKIRRARVCSIQRIDHARWYFVGPQPFPLGDFEWDQECPKSRHCWASHRVFEECTFNIGREWSTFD